MRCGRRGIRAVVCHETGGVTFTVFGVNKWTVDFFGRCCCCYYDAAVTFGVIAIFLLDRYLY